MLNKQWSIQVIFEASQLGPNSFVGIDEITLTDAFGQHICWAMTVLN